MDLTKFGTDEWPIHPSGINGLLTCPWRSVVRRLLEVPDEAGPAADTGSAMHVAAREFHRGADAAAAIAAMNAESSDYPRADLIEAAGLFLAYAGDARNSGAKVLHTELPIAFSIAPAEEDATQAPIQVIGTVDQVREEHGQLCIGDIKTSKKDPLELLYSHTTQVAAYAVGVSIALQRPVNKAYLILPRRYRADGSGPVFWHYPWKFEDCEQILAGLRHVVARIRNGDVWHSPNSGCVWCAAKSPDLCLPKLHEFVAVRKKLSLAVSS